MYRKFYIALFLTVFSVGLGFSQTNSGSLEGTVTDAETGEPLPFVNVIVLKGGSQYSGGNTDFDGKYNIKPVDPGTYDVQFSYVGYQSKKVTGVKVNSNKITFLDAKLSAGVQLEAAEVIDFNVPLIDKDGGASGGTVTRESIQKMPGRSAQAIATTVGGVNTAGTGGGISIRGARSDNTYYYIDGIKVRGSTNLPKSAIEEISVITGGVPANYGDATGGIISITTRGASSTYFGGVEFVTSGFKSGETAYGLDRFGYNLFEGFLSGPIAFKKDEEGNKTEPLLGFFVSGNYTSEVDPRPTYDGVWRITDEAKADILANPLRRFQTQDGQQGALYNTDFLQADAFERVPTRLNAGQRSGTISGKIDVTTTPTINLTFGGSGDFGVSTPEFASTRYDNMLMNWENNLKLTSRDWRVFGKFSQRFLDEENENVDDDNLLKNVYYTLMIDYSKNYQRFEDETHGDDYFKYGHVGYFDTYSRNSFTFDPEQNAFIHDGFEDTLVTYAPSPYNPNLAAINEQYFGLYDPDPYDPDNLGPYSNIDRVQNGNALRNGDDPSEIYNLWTYPGTQGNRYSLSNNSQFRVTAAGSADIGDHAVQIGFEYEQRRDNFFAISPVGLWTIGRQYVNSHIAELDTSSIANTYNQGNFDYIVYDRLIGEGQFQFDYRLRQELGLDPNGNDFIDFDAIDPEVLSLDMFSPDELLNQGNNLVSYYGYDAYGELQTGARPTIDDFFNETNERGELTRPIAAYEPVYIAGYAMDKFSFDDIIFNVGVRVDRFDANQPVLKDPYVVGDAITAGEVTSVGGQSVTHPGNIGDDYVVYVDDVGDPSSIVGYRTGNTWYNASGTIVDDPLVSLASTSGQPAPLLNGDPDELTEDAFEDYTPQVNVMPRIAFSFPISDEAVFFAHYDILTQRPTSNIQFNPIDYLFIESRNVLMNNPDLRPTRTVDYELGFQQVLTRTSSLKISAFYRDLKDMIQVRSFIGAYPRNYRTFSNLDFGTVKGLTVSYDLRRTGNVSIRGSYTLQFADGTGSTNQTALRLINAGLPNLRSTFPFNYDQRHRINATIDYRYGEGKDYNGPVWFGKQVFANTGANMIANLGSGTPYTSSATPFAVDGVQGSATTEGQINGSRLPWQFQVDLQIDRNFTLQFGKDEDGEKAKTANLNVYLWITNLFNTRNILDVYRFTGVADDDGYLSAAQFQQFIETQNSSSAYRNYYSMYANDPFNYGAPRTIRLGVKLDF
ncbi:carboxypeptidase regulatory-like domain-containing protein [Halocola ammonii]